MRLSCEKALLGVERAAKQRQKALYGEKRNEAQRKLEEAEARALVAGCSPAAVDAARTNGFYYAEGWKKR